MNKLSTNSNPVINEKDIALLEVYVERVDKVDEYTKIIYRSTAISAILHIFIATLLLCNENRELYLPTISIINFIYILYVNRNMVYYKDTDSIRNHIEEAKYYMESERYFPFRAKLHHIKFIYDIEFNKNLLAKSILLNLLYVILFIVYGVIIFK